MDIKSLILKETLDESGTLYVPELDEHYHSVNGALQEAMHVFIQAGFRHVANKKNEIKILEIGFGTGLNAFVTLQENLEWKLKIQYVGLEKYPLPLSIVEKLNYTPKTNNKLSQLFRKIHATEWGKSEEIDTHFFLHKELCDVTEGINASDIDLVYFDAFAPEKQAPMWEESVFSAIYNIMNTGGVLVTYCAKGEVRRRMQRAGFTVERLAGPPGKREMLRATK